MKKKLFVIFLFAFLIRLISLNQSLWLDEGTTAKVVQTFSLLDIPTKFSIHDFHPPLYYIFMKVWTNVFGYTEVALRMPSVIFSLLTGWFVYLIAKKIQKVDVSLWAVAFFLFNPLIIYYSQEARMYMMSTFFVTGSIYFLLNILVHPDINVGEYKKLNIKYQNDIAKIKYLFLLGLFMALSFLTFYGSIFFIASLLIYLFFKKQYKLVLVLGSTFLVLLLLLAPLLLTQWANARQMLGVVLNWSQVLGKANLKNLALIPLKFMSGRISFEPKTVYYAVCGIWTMMGVSFWFLGGMKNKFLLYFSFMPLTLGLLASFLTPLLQYFRFLYLLPFVSILMASGVVALCESRYTKNKDRIIHLQSLYLSLLSGYIIFSLVYLLIPSFHREDWKSLSFSLSSQQIYGIPSSLDALRYYAPSVNMIDIRSIDTKKVKDKEILVVSYTFDIYGIDSKSKLYPFTLSSTSEFRGVTYQLWTNK
ncbi:MAG: glycosyltransferase family 39 protein [bacterium]|nr:glycosyltransferase family 39 protein [bacterium]